MFSMLDFAYLVGVNCDSVLGKAGHGMRKPLLGARGHAGGIGVTVAENESYGHFLRSTST